MAEKITVEFNVEDNGSDELVKVNSELNKTKQAGAGAEDSTRRLAGSQTELRSTVMNVVDVFMKLKGVYNEVVGSTVDLANNVRQFRDVTGQSAEESSRLVQVLDDYKVSVGAAEQATKKMAKEGLQFNIQTLAELSDKYLALNSDVEKTAFLYDNFGKSGDQFAEIMLQGGDAILAANDAISEHLILTEKELKMAREYEKQVDDLSDSFAALKVSIGSELLPVANDFLEVMKSQVDEGFEWQDAIVPLAIIENIKKFSDALKNNTTAAQEADAARWSGLASMYETVEVTEDAAEAALNYGDVLSGAMKNTSDMEAFGEKQADTLEKLADLQAEKQELKNQGWWEESEKVQDVIAKIDELKGKYAEDAAAYAEAQKEKFAMNAIAAVEMEDGLAGFNEAEYEKARVVAETTGLISESGLEQQYAMQLMTDALLSGAIPSAEQYGAVLNQVMADGVVSVGEVKGAIEGLPNEKTITLNIQTNYSPGTQAALEAFSAGEKGGYSASVPGRASGGSVFAGQAYMVGERGAELFVPQTSGTIIPNGKGGNEEVVAALYATRIDEAKLARLVVEGILKGTR